MEELMKRMQDLADLRAMKKEAKAAGFEPRKEEHKHWNYSFYNEETDEIIGLRWKDKKNFSLTGLPGKKS
jgi:hypothetical protein